MPELTRGPALLAGVVVLACCDEAVPAALEPLLIVFEGADTACEMRPNRIRDDVLERVFGGDVMQVKETGGLFVVENAAVEQQRFDANETAITGPLFGPKMKCPSGEAEKRESAVLAESGLTVDDFCRYRKLTPGTRRPLLIRPQKLTVEPMTDAIRVHVELPPGVYATVLLREFMKTESE